MTVKIMNDRLNSYISLVNKRLDELIEDCPFGEDIVHQAMKYSLSAGGKRIRPVLVLESCRLCGGNIETAIDVACAIEMIHTYSLIHDDLPCMDDDELRRGKPSCHIRFGEAFALLAGDALLTRAFGVIAGSQICRNTPSVTSELISLVSECAGYNGMIGGQVLDLINEEKSSKLIDLELTDSLKTGELISCCVRLGALCAGADEKQIIALSEYAGALGLAFQITDDILDVTGDEKLFGKPVGSDIKSNKTTYVTLYGLEGAKKKAELLSESAIASLEIFLDEGDFLKKLAEMLLNRNS